MTTRNPGATARSGFTLVELMIGVVLLTLMLAISTPKIRGSVSLWNVKSARVTVANLYAKARVTAVQRRVTTTLRFEGNRAYIVAPRGVVLDTVGGVVDFMGEYGVTLTATSDVTVLPVGLVNAGVPIKVLVQKGVHADSVVISGYGRVE